jgi:hypothetical protein
MTTNAMKSDWLTCVASRAHSDEQTIEEVLAAWRIQPAPVPASPRRLLLRRIAFSGIKGNVANAGPFNFEWDSLDHGLWAMVTDGNLKGKSSVIEVVRWLLRGRTSDKLQEDVKSWISHALLRFQVDETTYDVRVEIAGEVRGSLVRLGKGGIEKKLASFNSDGEFEAVMSNFFMREFDLEAITNWLGATDDDGGKAVTHGWPALSSVMFTGTDYDSLLGDIKPVAGLSTRLMQMYLGLPWISTFMAAKAAQQTITRDNHLKEKQRSSGAAAKEDRINSIRSELEAKREELARTPPDTDLRTYLTELNAEFASMKSAERILEEQLSNTEKAILQADSAYLEDRHNLQAHLDAEAAGAVFRKLDPSCCPRCDSEIGEERRKREMDFHSCSVCGESIASDTDSETIQSQLKERVQASRLALDKASRDKASIADKISDIRERVRSLNEEIDLITTKLTSFSVRARVEIEIAVLEGRLDEAKYDVEMEEGVDGKVMANESEVINAIVTETEVRLKLVQTDLLKAVSERPTSYARRFGMTSLEMAELKGNATLPLVKAGENTSYSKVTAGEKLRLKIAAALSSISVGEELGVGRHPGLLFIDSPGAQEVSPKDLDEIIAGLEKVSKELGHLQVFVASQASKAIMKRVPPDRMRHAKGDAFLW